MSTLRVNNLTDTSGTAANLGIPGAAKAWVNFNGSGTVAIRDSFNVSSITDNGTGDYTVNFATPMSSTSYVPVLTTICRDNQSGGSSSPGIRSVSNHTSPNQSLATSSVRFVHRPTSTNVDADMYGLAVFGN